MKLTMAVWNGRISPVFDVSRQLEIFMIKNGKTISREEYRIKADNIFAKAAEFSDLGTQVIICGAVSRPLAEMIVARGIRLIPFMAGETNRVLASFLAGGLPDQRMVMPGCRGSQRRFRGCGRGRIGGWM